MPDYISIKCSWFQTPTWGSIQWINPDQFQWHVICNVSYVLCFCSSQCFKVLQPKIPTLHISFRSIQEKTNKTSSRLKKEWVLAWDRQTYVHFRSPCSHEAQLVPRTFSFPWRSSQTRAWRSWAASACSKKHRLASRRCHIYLLSSMSRCLGFLSRTEQGIFSMFSIQIFMGVTLDQ